MLYAYINTHTLRLQFLTFLGSQLSIILGGRQRRATPHTTNKSIIVIDVTGHFSWVHGVNFNGLQLSNTRNYTRTIMIAGSMGGFGGGGGGGGGGGSGRSCKSTIYVLSRHADALS